MKSRKIDRDGARTFATKGVEDFLNDFPQIEAMCSVEDYELSEHLTRLSELHAQEPPLDPHKQEDLVRYGFTRAWRQGLLPPGYVPKLSPYEAEVERLIQEAATKPVAYTALNIHMAGIESDGGVKIPQLRMFLTEILLEKRRKPPARGTPNRLLKNSALDAVFGT